MVGGGGGMAVQAARDKTSTLIRRSMAQVLIFIFTSFSFRIALPMTASSAFHDMVICTPSPQVPESTRIIAQNPDSRFEPFHTS